MSRPSSAFSSDVRCPSVSASVLSRDDAKRLYERTQQRWSQTNNQLSSAIWERTTSPMSPIDSRQKDLEIANLRNELQHIQAEMTRYREELREATRKIEQQAATIRNQSHIISRPEGSREFPLTPSHQRYNVGGYGMNYGQGNQVNYNIHGQHPPYMSEQSFNTMFGPALPHNINSIQHPPNMTNMDRFGNHAMNHTPQGRYQSGNMRPNDLDSPTHHRLPKPSYTSSNFAGGNQPQNSAQNGPNGIHDPFLSNQINFSPNGFTTGSQSYPSPQSVASPESFVSNPYPETCIPDLKSLVLASDVTHDVKFKERFQKIFDMAQKYALNYANYPSTAGDNALPKDIKEKLLSAATVTTAFPLMSDPQTRYLLVAKIIIAWLVKHILKFNAFSGLDSNIDTIINGTKATIYQSTPSQIRFLMLTNVATEFKKLRARPDFNAYVEHLSQQRANQLLPMLRPMMHQRPVNELTDLVTLLRETYKVAEIMFAVTDEFSFDFFQHGGAFDQNEMINIDPSLGGVNVLKLQELRATVRLGATPIIRIRKNVANGMGQEYVLLKAKVCLRKLG